MSCAYVHANGKRCASPEWIGMYCWSHEPDAEARRLAIAHDRGVRQKRKRPAVQLAEWALAFHAWLHPLRGRDRLCAPGPGCCDRAGIYNGFGSDGPLLFTCPASCCCHD